MLFILPFPAAERTPATMANSARTPGKHGWLPRSPHRRVPVLEHYLRPWEGRIHSANPLLPAMSTRQLLQPAVGDIDRETAVTDWPMYVNGPDPLNPDYAPDGLGDCTIAGICHAFAAMAVYAGYPEPMFSTDAIVAAYSACGGYVRGDASTDNGCDMPTVLNYMTRAGIPDVTGKVHKVAAWAAFGDPQNERLLAEVLAATGTAYLGSEIQDAQEAQFGSGVWEWEPGGTVAGGHCYVLQRRRVGGVGVLDVVTWGAVQRATRSFWWSAASPSIGGGEAYYVASEDYVRACGTTVQGLDLAQLAGDAQDVS